MTNATRILSLITVTLMACQVHAWGPTGHRVVAQIAQKHLSISAQLELKKLIGSKTLPDVANWADEIRNDPNYANVAPLHYTSVSPQFKSYREAPVPADGDIVSALEVLSEFLKTAHPEVLNKIPALTKMDRAQALKLIVHFVGDLHQPLHVGDPADKGGNMVKVNWMGHWTSNLHSIWDDEMIDQEKMSYTEYAKFLDHPSTSDLKTWQTLDFVKWADESLNARSQAYQYPDKQTPNENPFIFYSYISKSRELMRQRLLQGGIRLALLLNTSLTK